MIPKLIHYCWFGGGEFSVLHEMCMETWSDKLPGYEFVRWDESNVPKSNYVDYYLKKKKWAFVSDYVRLEALDHYGGIYLDVDVEVIKSFDMLLSRKVFLGEELPGRINNAVLGAEKGSAYIKACKHFMLDRYLNKKSQMLSPEVSTEVYNDPSVDTSDVTVLPMHFFYPYNPFSEDKRRQQLMSCLITNETYAIHHWAKSWDLSLLEKVKRRMSRV